MKEKTVSIIIPVYNEEKHIDLCISSLINQTYPVEKMEWIFVDGNSSDETVLIIKKYMEQYPVRLLVNLKRKTPESLNMAIVEAKGEYIIRLDAHASFAEDYLEKCIYYLETMDIENVGGIAETEASGFVGGAIAKMLSTKFGVGNSDFRVGEGGKYVDTVPFGAFKRDLFDRVGFFDTELLRSEDNDMNARIRESGGKIWLASDIHFKYYCRETIYDILKMGIQNGNALFRTMKKNSKAMSIRHFIPFLFLISLLLLPLFGIFLEVFSWIFIVEAGCYLLLDFYFSFIKAEPTYGIITMWLYPVFHICYGLGSLLGLFGIRLY